MLTEGQTQLSYKESLKPHWFAILIASFFTIILAITTAWIGILAGPLFVEILKGREIAIMLPEVRFLFPQQGLKLSDPLQLIGIVALIAVARFIASMGQWAIWEWVAESVMQRLRRAFYNKLLRINPTQLSQPEILFSQDQRILKDFYVRFFGGIPREGISTLLLVWVLFELNTGLSLWLFGLIAPTVFILRRFGKKIQVRSAISMKSVDRLSQWLQVRLEGMVLIRQYGMEPFERQGFAQVNRQVSFDALRYARTRSKISPFFELCGILALAWLMYLCLQMIINNAMAADAFISYLATAVLMSQSAAKMTRYYAVKKRVNASEARLRSFFESEDSPSAAPGVEVVFLPAEQKVGKAQEVLRIENLEMSFSPENRICVPQLSFEAGKFYLIKGRTGLGKSTLLGLCFGFVPSSIQTKAKVTWQVRRDQIGFLPQKGSLVSEDFLESLSYPRILAEGSEVELSQLAPLIARLKTQHLSKQKLKNLSGGEEQRVGLLRVLSHPYRVRMLDESTSALDPQLESTVLQLLKEDCKNNDSCVILISHRPSAEIYADEVIDLSQYAQ